MSTAEMDAIMQERIEKYNNFVMAQDIDKMPVGLFYGKMGHCIYFYELSRITSQKKYADFADNLLDSVLAEINDYTAVDPENGLSGICMALNYLIQNNYIKGNSNIVLKEFDYKIIKSLLFNRILDDDKKVSIGILRLTLGTLYYLATRLENTKMSNNDRYIIQNTIIEYVNKFESYSIDKLSEPNFYSTNGYFIATYLKFLVKIYLQNFFNYKIERIINELSNKIQYIHPILSSNRLVLVSTMRFTIDALHFNKWNEKIDILEKSTSTQAAILEFRNKNVMYYNGLAGCFFLLKQNVDIFNENDKKLLLKKLCTSDVWDTVFSDEKKLETMLGLYTGFSGLILTYYNLISKKVNISFLDEMF